MQRFRRSATAIGLAATVLLGGWHASAQSLSNEQVLRNFDIVAFGNEYTGQRFDHVRKWRRPIRAAIKGNAPAYLDSMVKEFLAELQAATGHPMSLVYSRRMERARRLPPDFDPKRINLFILYYPLDKMAAQLPKGFGRDRDMVLRLLRTGETTCMAKLFKKGSEIRVAIVLFPAHHPKRVIRACVVEELTQILGLPNDSDRITESIFRDRGRYNELTWQDRLMLRILYDRRITPGMPRRDALRIARRILERLRPGY